MKKKSLLFFTILLLIVGVFSNPNYSDASPIATDKKVYNGEKIITTENVVISKEEINRLLNIGYTLEEIEHFSQEEYNRNKDLEGYIVSEDTKYYKIVETLEHASTLKNDLEEYDSVVTEISENEFEQAKVTNPTPYDTTSTSYKSMTTTLSYLTSKNRYNVKSSVTWKIMPKNRNVDILHTGISSGYIPHPGSQYAKQTWTLRNTANHNVTESGSATYNNTSNKWSYNSNNGYAVKMDLKNDIIQNSSGKEVFKLSMYSSYEAKKNKTVAYLQAVGCYYHLETNITPSVSFSLFPSSVSISGNVANSYKKHLREPIAEVKSPK